MVSAKALGKYNEFSDLKGFGRIEATWETDGKVTSETRFFTLSWMPAPDVLLITALAHSLCPGARAYTRKNNGPSKLAVLRPRALDVVRLRTPRSVRSASSSPTCENDDDFRSILTVLSTLRISELPASYAVPLCVDAVLCQDCVLRF